MSEAYWDQVRSLSTGVVKRCAIAFVTKDLVGFGRGDVLVVNASEPAIKKGQTAAALLLRLFDKGFKLYNCSNLHAKVLLLGDWAVVGSGNMSDASNSPERGWLEAGYVSNEQVIVGGVPAFVEQLTRRKGAYLERDNIVKLTKIKVLRRGGGWRTGAAHRVAELGNRTWIAAMHPVKSTAQEDQDAEEVEQKLGTELSWVRFPLTRVIAKLARPGDSLISLWRPHPKARVRAYRATPILLARRRRQYMYFYYRDPEGRDVDISWSKFQQLLKTVKYPHHVGPNSVQLIAEGLANTIERRWRKAARD